MVTMVMKVVMGITVMKTNSLVDLHCHILPGIDDGSPDVATSLELAQQAVNDGIGYILATPHHLDRHYVNHAADVQQAVKAFQVQLDRQHIPLTVFAGQEVHLNGDLMVHLDDLLGIDTSSNYLLLELPHETVPSYLKEVIFQLACEGITPVIAHPERNAQLLATPEKLYELVKQGGLAQVIATSLVGTFGERVQRMAVELVKSGLVQVVASDAHSLPNRQFAMTAAYDVLAKLDATYPVVFQANARRLLNGEPLEKPLIRKPHKWHRFWRF